MIFCDEHECISNIAGTCGVPNPEIHLHGTKPYCASHHDEDKPSTTKEVIAKEHHLKVS